MSKENLVQCKTNAKSWTARCDVKEKLKGKEGEQHFTLFPPLSHRTSKWPRPDCVDTRTAVSASSSCTTFTCEYANEGKEGNKEGKGGERRWRM